MMQKSIDHLRRAFVQECEKVSSLKDVEEIRVRYLGKKGHLSELMLRLKECMKEERPLFGKDINALRDSWTAHIEELLKQWTRKEALVRMQQETIDVTMPGRRSYIGKAHPIYQLRDTILAILTHMGFSVQYGPDMDLDYYNYEGLNFPEDHPARDMQDTFYLTKNVLLRSHTSNTQLRVMEAYEPPIRIVAPGTVYRNETVSSRSHVFFHQIEGLYVDKGVSFADLISTMRIFFQKLLGQDALLRFRPSYFPFVEPGVEVDVHCTACKGVGCRLCKQSGWLEVAGAGMVHPRVLQNGKIDPKVYSGYAWGIGVERLALLLYGVTDIRAFAENDMRFLRQFVG